MAKKGTKTIVQTKTLTKRVTRTLTREEELVVRMRHGLSEGADFELEFRGQEHPQVRAHLAAIENAILEELREDRQSSREVDLDVKNSILDRLSKLED